MSNSKIMIIMFLISVIVIFLFYSSLQKNVEPYTSKNTEIANLYKITNNIETSTSSINNDTINQNEDIKKSKLNNNGGVFLKDTSLKIPYYDTNNYDTQYHDDINTIAADSSKYGLPADTAFVKDKDGNFKILSNPKFQSGFTFYSKGEYEKYGPRSFVPSYEDSVYLSKTFNFLPHSMT